MENKSKEYYDQFTDDLMRDYETIKYHERQAEGWRRIYEATKNMRGLMGYLNRIAGKRNRIHCLKGLSLASKNVKRCIQEMDCLNDFLKNGAQA